MGATRSAMTTARRCLRAWRACGRRRPTTLSRSAAATTSTPSSAASSRRASTPLMPKASTTQKTIEQTMVQGGTFVFDGTKELFAHYDFSSGDHADLDEVVRIATGKA